MSKSKKLHRSKNQMDLQDTLQDTKRKFSNMLDKTKDAINEERSEKFQTVKDSIRDLRKTIEAEEIMIKNLGKKLQKLEAHERAVKSVQNELDGIKIPSEAKICETLIKHKEDTEKKLAQSFGILAK